PSSPTISSSARAARITLTSSNSACRSTSVTRSDSDCLVSAVRRPASIALRCTAATELAARFARSSKSNNSRFINLHAPHLRLFIDGGLHVMKSRTDNYLVFLTAFIRRNERQHFLVGPFVHKHASHEVVRAVDCIRRVIDV